MRARVRAALSNCLLSVQASEDVDGEDDEESLLLNVSHAAMSMRPPPEKQTRHTIASPIRLRLITPWRRIPDNVAGNGRRGRNKRVGAQEMQMTADLRRGLPSNSRLKSPPPRRLTPRYLSCAHSSSAHVKRRRGGGRGGGGGDGRNLKSKSLESEESDLLCSRSKILKRERERLSLCCRYATAQCVLGNGEPKGKERRVEDEASAAAARMGAISEAATTQPLPANECEKESVSRGDAAQHCNTSVREN